VKIMTSAASPAAAGLPPQEADPRRLRQLQSEGRHGEALALARERLAQFPGDRDFGLIEASALRHMRHTDEAFASLDRLATFHPHFSLLHQERGLCHVARRDAPAAIAALLAATAINPALPVAWKMLNGLWRMSGDEMNAARAEAQAAALAALPPEVAEATSLFSDGDLETSEEIVRRFLLAEGDHPEAMRLLAKIGVAREVYDDAEILLGGVLTLVPGHRVARYEYAHVLTLRHKPLEAEAALAPLLAEEPDNSQYRTLASTIAVGLGRHDEAIALYRDLLAELPETADTAFPRADLNLWLGHALKTTGAFGPAIDAYRAAIAARLDFGDAYWSLANLKTYRFTDDEIAAMRAAEGAPDTQPIDRVHLCFALGKAFEDRSDRAASWDYYARGNGLQRAKSRYRPDLIEANTRLQREICTPAFFAARRGWGDPGPDPIFILGLPRAGSTLIEQILASHSQVEGTQELPDIQRFVVEMQGRDPDLDHPLYPGMLANLTEADARRLGERYLADTRVHRSGRPFFIDKMPNNFRHIGLIHLILPNAKIIDARRDPMSCCFSNLKQLFAQGQEFSYSIEDIARYYRTYLDLMAHWDEALPGRVLRVQHEDVIDDLEGTVRRMLDHCGLPFEDACLSFHQNKRSVRTPSSEQVRRPIFRDGLEQWANYRPWLGPLEDALGDALTRYREEPARG
jgi:tetratricopeptide (TPR) repeat protein